MKATVLSLIGLLLLGGGAWWFVRSSSEASGPLSAVNRSAARSFASKMAAVALPETRSGGGQTEFTESEINAFLHFEIARHYPRGVRQIQLRFHENALTARALVDFDEIETDSDRTVDALVGALLRGEHWLEVSGKLTAEDGLGQYDVLGVRIDDQEIPRPLVDLLLAHYVLPRYPRARPNTDFSLPFELRSIKLTSGKLSVRYGA